MRFAIVCALLIGAVGLSACNKATSPDKVQADIAKASQEAAANNAKAEETQQKTEIQASDELAKAKADAEAKAADKSVGAVADAALVEAEGANKIALAKCEALEGDAQQQCKDKADAHLKTVKQRVAAAKDNSQPSQSQ
jgi:hypothetical protein